MASSKIKDISKLIKIETSETVRDAIRQLALEYGKQASSLEEVRNIVGRAGEKSGETLSQAVRKMREEAV